MNSNISKRRTSSVIPAVNAFNNWFNVPQKKPITMHSKSTKLSQSFYHSTMPVNPQSSDINFEKSSQRPRRTYSAFRNTSSKLSAINDNVFEVSRDIKQLIENSKRTKLDMTIMKKQLTGELSERQLQMRMNMQQLNKLVKSTVKESQIRNSALRQELVNLKDDYQLIKQSVHQMRHRLSQMESSCGFMTFANKLHV